MAYSKMFYTTTKVEGRPYPLRVVADVRRPHTDLGWLATVVHIDPLPDRVGDMLQVAIELHSAATKYQGHDSGNLDLDVVPMAIFETERLAIKAVQEALRESGFLPY